MGVWGQVCGSGTNWNDAAANVTCRQLGYIGGVAYGTVNNTFKPIWVTKLNCNGNETSLAQCITDDWGKPIYTCKPAYVLCYKQGRMHAALRQQYILLHDILAHRYMSLSHTYSGSVLYN